MNKQLLLMPVENQVRELDSKLLLACIAARKGFSSVIGSRRELEFNIDMFPQSVYLSKSMTVRSLLFFRVARPFGHEIVSWDEEALVHLPPETYYSRRLDPTAIKYVSHLFAWGEDNAELWRNYPAMPKDMPIHITGNPRGDLLRPELRAFYENEAESIRKRYGDFILINTNFNHVNAFGPDMNLFKPVKRPGQTPKFGRAARGMSREYAEGLRDHKLAVFNDFKELVPFIDRNFPGYNIVVRPHPTENHAVYHEIASKCQQVHVTNKGNVVPWLMAAKALVHNGCTTGVEAYVIGLPAISYRKTVNEKYDYGFYRLPNTLSYQCFNLKELKEMLNKALAGELAAPKDDDRQAILDRYLAAQDGLLACERIVNVLVEIVNNRREVAVSMDRVLKRWLTVKGLHIARYIKTRLPGSHNKPEFQRHRFPPIAIDDMQTRLHRLQWLLGDKKELQVSKVSDVIFRVDA